MADEPFDYVTRDDPLACEISFSRMRIYDVSSEKNFRT